VVDAAARVVGAARVRRDTRGFRVASFVPTTGEAAKAMAAISVLNLARSGGALSMNDGRHRRTKRTRGSQHKCRADVRTLMETSGGEGR
jgi:hypothetical protein